jgi:DNA mismatch repair protein MutS2
VTAQSIHIRVPLRRIVGIVRQENKPQPEKSTVNIDVIPKEELPHSIDIHGMTRDEALPIIEKFLDRANLGEWREVYIIHGQGYGVLRNLVRRTLDKHPLVKSYRPGDSLEGGTGVTVATLYGS